MCINEALLEILSCDERNSKIALIFSTNIYRDGIGHIRVIVTKKK